MKARLAVTAGLLAVFLAADGWGATRRYAVVVAHNRALASDAAPLEYADDDAARYHELFGAMADRTLLFAVLDTATQRLHPGAARVARAPTRARVLDGIAGIFAEARADVARGDEAEFYLVLIGHGEIASGGEGYVSLLDAPFTRTDLYREVLARSPATTNHVIIDACNSYYLVRSRGGEVDDSGPGRGEVVREFLAGEELDRYPNTGVLLSTSAARDSHEWSAYGAGVFSHQLRSALAGAADVNGDGRVEYSEAQAFLAAANAGLDDPRARIDVYARAPTLDQSRPLVDLATSRFRHWLRVPAGTPLRFYLEDARGVRYLDAHLDGSRAFVLALAPSAYYFVRTDDGTREIRLSLAAPGRVDLNPARLARAAVASRGALSDAFRASLFALPFGPGFYGGFVTRQGARPVIVVSRPFAPPAQEVDVPFVHGELSRLNARAASDPALRRRLRAVAGDVIQDLHDRRPADAWRRLEDAELGD